MPITNVPVRLEILRAITAALIEINPDNGYEFDLRPAPDGQDRVVRGRLHIGDSEPIPMVTVVEAAMSPEALSTKRQVDNAARLGEWDLVVQGWTQEDRRYPTDTAYQLEAEVRRRLALEMRRPDARPGLTSGRNYFGMGKKITSMTIGPPVVRPNEHVSEQGVFFFVLTLQIVEDMLSVSG